MKRRTLLKTGASITALAAGSVPAAARDRPVSRPTVKPGVNQIDVDEDGETDVDIVPAQDPAEDGQNPGQGNRRVAHGTSDETKTVDYAATVRPLNVPLGHFTGGGTLTYEYYEGPAKTHAAPDEVWLEIRDENGDDHVVWHTANDNFSRDEVPADETWHTRNVHKEILGDPDPEDNPRYFWFEIVDESPQVIQEDTGDNHVANLVDVFGEESRIRRFAIGIGRARGEGAVSDVYFRNLRLDGRPRPIIVNRGPNRNGVVRSDYGVR